MPKICVGLTASSQLIQPPHREGGGQQDYPHFIDEDTVA